MNITHDVPHNAFVAYTDNGKQIGKIVYAQKGAILLATHTRVSSDFQGQGVGEKLLDTLVAYAKENNMTITPLCSYVQSAFQKHPEKYSRIESLESVSMIPAEA